MSVNMSSLDPSNAVAVRVAKLALDQTKVEGEAAVQMIEDASVRTPPPVGPEGQGSVINTYA